MRTYDLLIVTISLASLNIQCSNTDGSQEIEGTGTIEAIQVDVSSSIAGEVKAMFFEEGDRVNTGDTLLLIKDTDYRIQQKLAGAQLAAAQARLKLLLAGSRTEDIERAQQEVKATQASFEKAQSNYERIENIFKTGSATKSLYDEAKAAFDMARANYQASQKVLEKLLKGARTEEIEIVQADKAQAEANLELADKRVADCVITAPLGGIITNKLVEAGERLMPNGIIATISKTDSMWITIFVGERQIGRVKIRQRAKIQIDSHEDLDFDGEVRFISEEAEFTPKNIQTKDEREKLVFAVKIKVANQEGILKSGLPADAEIFIGD